MSDPTPPAVSEAMREAVAYLTPHPATKGPVILDPAKMREAQATIASEIARLTGERDDEAEIVALLKETNAWQAKRINELVAAEAETARLRAALEGMTEHYCQLVNSGDAGFWDPESDERVKTARAALTSQEKTDV